MAPRATFLPMRLLSGGTESLWLCSSLTVVLGEDGGLGPWTRREPQAQCVTKLLIPRSWQVIHIGYQ